MLVNNNRILFLKILLVVSSVLLIAATFVPSINARLYSSNTWEVLSIWNINMVYALSFFIPLPILATIYLFKPVKIEFIKYFSLFMLAYSIYFIIMLARFEFFTQSEYSNGFFLEGAYILIAGALSILMAMVISFRTRETFVENSKTQEEVINNDEVLI